MTLEPGGSVNNVLVPEFNSALGTLQNVTVTLDWTFTGDVDVLNTDNANHDSAAGIHGYTNTFADIPLTISGNLLPAVQTTIGISGLNSPAGQVAAPTENFSSYNVSSLGSSAAAFCTGVLGGTYNAANGTCLVPTTPPTYTPGEYISPATTTTGSACPNTPCAPLTGAALAAFTGSANQLLTYNVSAGVASYGGSETGGTHFLHFGGSGNGGGVLVVTYNYLASPVPEPASLLLVGLVLLGGGATWRRRSGGK